MLPVTSGGQSGSRSFPESRTTSPRPKRSRAFLAHSLPLANSRRRFSTARATMASSSGNSGADGSRGSPQAVATSSGNKPSSTPRGSANPPRRRVGYAHDSSIMSVSSERIDVLVIGAGVVGLAVGRELARAGREVLIVEAEPTFGSHTSSRNSEVIHAGIYYPTGSKKALSCVRGKGLLYGYCEQHGVPHRRLGKLIVATRDDELPQLEKIRVQAEANGVADLEWLEARRIAELEPAVHAVRGLFSPSSGIVDSHAVMASFLRDAREAHAELVLGSPILSGAVTDAGIELAVGGAEPVSILCN